MLIGGPFNGGGMLFLVTSNRMAGDSGYGGRLVLRKC